MKRTYIAKVAWSVLGGVLHSVRPKGGKPLNRRKLPTHIQQYLNIKNSETNRNVVLAGDFDKTLFDGLTANADDILQVTRRRGLLYVTFRIDDNIPKRHSAQSLKAAGGPIIRNLQQLCDHFSADTPRSLNRRIYKDTDCGASISVYVRRAVWRTLCKRTAQETVARKRPRDGDIVGIHNGSALWDVLKGTDPIEWFTIQTIVEGSDAEVNSDKFILPVAARWVSAWIQDMEAQASDLWNEANNEQEEAE